MHRLVAPRDQKYQSNFVEASNRYQVHLEIVKDAERSSAIIKLYTDAMQAYSSVFVWMPTTTN